MAFGSMPPRIVQIESTGRDAAIKPMTGIIRAASLPKTTSAFDKSVTSKCRSVPRALSRQMAPAVAAGAASSTTDKSVPKNP